MTPRRPTDENTPQPVDVDTVIRIVEDKVRIGNAEHERDCGHVRRLHERIDTMEVTVSKNRDAIQQFVGQQKVTRWAVPMIVGILVGVIPTLLRMLEGR
jgi:hypothetical protein